MYFGEAIIFYYYVYNKIVSKNYYENNKNPVTISSG